MAFQRGRGSALELVAIPCTKLQGGVSGGHHRETMGDEGCRGSVGAEKGGCKPREGLFCFFGGRYATHPRSCWESVEKTRQRRFMRSGPRPSGVDKVLCLLFDGRCRSVTLLAATRSYEYACRSPRATCWQDFQLTLYASSVFPPARPRPRDARIQPRLRSCRRLARRRQGPRTKPSELGNRGGARTGKTGDSNLQDTYIRKAQCLST